MYFALVTTVKNVATRLELLRQDREEKTSLIISQGVPKLRDAIYTNIQLFRASPKVVNHKPYIIDIDGVKIDTFADVVDIIVEKLKITYTYNVEPNERGVNERYVDIVINGSDGVSVIKEVTLLKKNSDLEHLEQSGQLINFDKDHYITKETYTYIQNALQSFKPSQITLEVDKQLEEDIEKYGIYKLLDILYKKANIRYLNVLDFRTLSEYKETGYEKASKKEFKVIVKDTEKFVGKRASRTAFYRWLNKRAVSLEGLRVWVLIGEPTDNDIKIINKYNEIGYRISILKVPLLEDQIYEILYKTAKELYEKMGEYCNKMKTETTEKKRQNAKKNFNNNRERLINVKNLAKSISDWIYKTLETDFKDYIC